MNTALNFVATFAGVLASFSLWLLGEHVIKQRSQSKDREMMCKEVCDEAQLNVVILDKELEFAKKVSTGGDIPAYLPRLLRSASIYAITSGNVRFLRSREK